MQRQAKLERGPPEDSTVYNPQEVPPEEEQPEE